MSGRKARIERIVRLRDERLKQAVRALEECRQLERRMHAEHGAARTARLTAEAARRDLSQTRASILAFIEAEEWLRSQMLSEELAARRHERARAALERAIGKVNEARMKVRQLEQLVLRLDEAERKKQRRTERTRDDEIGQRAAQLQRGRGSS